MSKLNPIPQNEQVVAQMFDNIAPRYDFLNKLLSMRQDRFWRAKMIKRLPTMSQKKGKLLDVATGTCDVLTETAQLRSDYSDLFGVDISREMLAQGAKKKVPNDRVLHLKQMSAENLRFPDQTFDAITISFGLRNVVRKEQALKEFHRVLKPGGKLFILEFFAPRSGLMYRGFSLYFKHILPTIGGLLSDKKAYRYLPESVSQFYSPIELVDKINQAGLCHEETEKFLFGGCQLFISSRKDSY